VSRLYAWCWGATAGYIFGWLAGAAVRDRAEARRLGRPETRASVTVRRSGGLAGSQAAEGRAHLEAALSDEIPTQRAGEPCTHTLGALTCPFRGPHTAHAFQSGTWAPDRKHDTDEGID
jgi:hypothetical protein